MPRVRPADRPVSARLCPKTPRPAVRAHPSASPLPRHRTSTSTSSVLFRRRSRAVARAPPPSVLPRRQPPPTSAATLAKPPQRPSSTCTVPSPPTLAGKVPDLPCVAPHRRLLWSRRSPWTRRWAGSQLGHGPPRPSVVVGRTRTVCASELSHAWAAAWSGASGPPPEIRPVALFLVFLISEFHQVNANSKICTSLIGTRKILK
jgi:hypothetical protein